jgi:hypothetical protein
MAFEIDHAFVGCTPGAPEADALLARGFVEGSPNTHPGQGTANRRFFFENFMLEFLWVTDPKEATSAQTSRTRLWERCTHREARINPFGIILRAAGGVDAPPPFATWPYYASYLPRGLALQVASGTTLQEPELFYLPFLRPAANRSSEPKNHALPLRRLRALSVGVANPNELSRAHASVRSAGQVSYFESTEPVLKLCFEGAPNLRADLRPAAPLIFATLQ